MVSKQAELHNQNHSITLRNKIWRICRLSTHRSIGAPMNKRLHSMDLHDGAKFQKEESGRNPGNQKKIHVRGVYAGVDVGGGGCGLGETQNGPSG
ncbi:hypothetical protein M0R45_027521 [Rubus argutus]|uniref:Uncharacterized protein n=1 Tax=Rubus argutus TaxID=59490 RepID=A0AAW1X209_RUBAR